MNALQRSIGAMSIGLLLPAPLLAAPAPQRPAWPDTPPMRATARALLQSLESALLSHASATLVLDEWCARHHLAGPGEKVVAERVAGRAKPATAKMRVLLRVGAGEPIRYRRVRLRCGARILSEADNWYVPARLSPAMNRQLDTTDISFGRVAQPLRFQRHTLSSRLLWAPSPSDRSGPTLAIPDKLIEQRAVLSLPDGTPFSAVVETYTSAILAFPAPSEP